MPRKRKRNPLDPRTTAEWQDAVDAAIGMRAIADCKMYGLIEGGPVINVKRCDEIIRRGMARGIQPSASSADLVRAACRGLSRAAAGA